jgi:hypothetical protein
MSRSEPTTAVRRMDWFRSHHGAPMDPKWILIARQASTIPGVVASVWWALMDHASQNSPRGSAEHFNTAVVAAFYGYDEDVVTSVCQQFRNLGMIDTDNMLSAFPKRNPIREDDSAQRVRELRERNAVKRTVTQRNAKKRSVTQRNAVKRLDESREEESREEITDDGGAANASPPHEGGDENQREAANGRQPEGWTAKACESWQKHMGGAAPGGRIGKALKPLVVKFSEGPVLEAWDEYLSSHVRAGTGQFANANDFATRYGYFREHGVKMPGAAGNNRKRTTDQQHYGEGSTAEVAWRN